MPVLAHDVYTQQPSAGPYVIFPTHAHQILSNCIHIVGVSVLSYCFARRTENDRFTSWLWWSNLTWARLLIILIFLDSWFFLAFSGVLVNGVGLSYSMPVCSLGIFGCIFFYCGSKVLTYLFLVERVWVVCSAGKSVTRMGSRIYKGCAVVVFGYTAIFIVMILGRYTDIRDDGVCVIGLHSFATIPLLTYDLFINVLLTSMFIWFLYREQSIGERLRRLARRTAIAAGIALTTSCVNILILASLHGKQLGWVCLGSCAADVLVNALVLFWVTGGAARDPYWHGAWEHKDGGGYVEPHELPPLHFPVSFVADPEVGLSRVKTVEGSLQQTQSRGINERLSVLDEDSEFCEGSSKDGHPGHEQYLLTDGHRESEDDKCDRVENTEWDITDSVSSSNTHFKGDSKDDIEFDDKDSGLRSWRLTLDLELQRPPLILQEHSEPDSPATHETGGSSARLTPGTPDTLHFRACPQKQRKDPKKQRRKQWHARSRRGRARSRQRSASSPPTTPHLSRPPNGVSSDFESSPPSALCTPSPPGVPQRAPPRRYVLRSHSDSLVRGVSDVSLLPGRPRLSQ